MAAGGGGGFGGAGSGGDVYGPPQQQGAPDIVLAAYVTDDHGDREPDCSVSSRCSEKKDE